MLLLNNKCKKIFFSLTVSVLLLFSVFVSQTVYASTSTIGSGSTSPGSSKTFTFSPPSSNYYKETSLLYDIYTTGGADTYGKVYFNGSLRASNNNSGSGNNFLITTKMDKSTPYTIKVSNASYYNLGQYTLYGKPHVDLLSSSSSLNYSPCVEWVRTNSFGANDNYRTASNSLYLDKSSLSTFVKILDHEDFETFIPLFEDYEKYGAYALYIRLLDQLEGDCYDGSLSWYKTSVRVFVALIIHQYNMNIIMSRAQADQICDSIRQKCYFSYTNSYIRNCHLDFYKYRGGVSYDCNSFTSTFSSTTKKGIEGYSGYFSDPTDISY